MISKRTDADTRDGSYWNLANPLSQFFGGTDKYPEFMHQLTGGNTKAAWLISKMGLGALIVAAATGLVRGGRHLYDMSELARKDDPAKNIRTDLSTTFKGNMSPDKERKEADLDKAAAETAPKHTVSEPSAWDISENTMRIGLPVASVLLASALTYKAVDKAADASRNAALTTAINNKRNAVRQLMMTRARVGKGNATQEEVDNAIAQANSQENYVKAASLDKQADGWFGRKLKQLNTSAGLLALGLGLTSLVGGYKYFSATDPNNIRFKAMKKGLREYATQKSMMTPITSIPDDAQEYFEGIDEGSRDRSSARDLPEKEPARRMLSMGID